jgi:ribosomal protein S18 acetylase RimI-like enzyme
MGINLCKLTVCDIDESYELISNVTRAIRSAGINQWDSLYPDKAIIMHDINGGNAYGCFWDSKLAGYIALNEEYPPEYDSIPWIYGGKNLIVHRLAIAMEYQRKGLGMYLMKCAISYAKENCFDSIRLDAYAVNKSSNALYNKLGFRKSGEISFRTGLFYCYELAVLNKR